MAKEVPYFKFFPAEWLSGDITLLKRDLQGLFVDICSYYWTKECDISLDKLRLRYKSEVKALNNLISSDIIKVQEDKVVIEFLNEQYQHFTTVAESRAEAGRKSGESRMNRLKEDEAVREVIKKRKIIEEANKEIKKISPESVVNIDKVDKEVVLLSQMGKIPYGYSEIMLRWLKYKRQRGSSYKDASTAKAALSKLVKLSGGNVDNAMEIVENSIANNYMGLFPLKPEFKPEIKPEINKTSEFNKDELNKLYGKTRPIFRQRGESSATGD